jgi:NIMA (never in mitosis gene a)-related kinase|eukprot:TRINITY_DN57208_c0_g1_i1.p1 TRINITY_DN57208_c0_g1~~TRINITY_DN57208_c0_g1_i1.p1  ORF type:complete len:420 (+),score=62.31 TRINITY_DN57208_c0_g1_i1:70-1329(+)
MVLGQAMAAEHENYRAVLGKHGYTEVRKIGEGSFGKALLVQTMDGASAVCKMVDVSKASAKERQDAIKEGQLLASLKYPYIVRYRDNFADSGWFCIIMDYCKGGDLSQQIEKAKKSRVLIPEEQILKWFTQAVLALKYIHDRHILHRDLKPGNFFISKSGSLKMGDFGIAKVLSCTLACAKTQIGTPYYLSPEVCQEKPYAWGSDIWAMGCLLYELCAQRVPFDSTTLSGLVQKIVRGPIPEVPKQYSPFVRELDLQMLNRSANMRPSTDEILKRPQIQSLARQMMEDAEDPEDGGGRRSMRAPTPSRGSSRGSSPAPPRLPRDPSVDKQAIQAPSPSSAGYKPGDLVEYYSATHNDWLPASVLKVDATGGLVINLKPNTTMSKEEQLKKLRRRRSSSKSRPPTPGRGASHSRARGGGA